MYKHFIVASLVGACVLPVVADSPDFTFVRSIEIASSTEFWPRMVAVTADSSGGVYFSENAARDDIMYMADPLTAAADTDTALVFAGTPVGFSSGSWMGMSVDPNGTVFASGSGVNKSALLQIVKSGETFTPTLITLPAQFESGTGFTRLGGCTAVGPNKLAIPGYSDGNLYFFTVSGGVATLDGSVPAPVGFTGVAPHALYVNGRIYMTNGVAGATNTSPNGGLYYWTSDGTIAGTVNPVKLADPKPGSASTNALYQSVSFNSTFNVLATNESHNAANEQGWAMYDTFQEGTPWTPYTFINGSEAGAPGALPEGDAALGHTFFEKSGTQYFIASNEDATRKFLVYQLSPKASVSDWSVY